MSSRANFRDAQAAVDEEIQRLKHQRNSLAPISRLPPEVLTKIFYESLSTGSMTKPTTFNPHSRITSVTPHVCPWAPDAVSQQWSLENLHRVGLLHVCQTWRSVALSSPQLWKHIQLQWSTNPQLIQFAVKHAKSTPIDLDIRSHNTISDEGGGRAVYDTPMEVLSELVCVAPGRVDSLTLNVGGRLVLDHIQRLFSRLDQAVSVEVTIWEKDIERRQRLHSMEWLASKAPRLRSLTIRGITIPWSSAILRSPNLNHVILHATLHQTTSAANDFRAFLREATQLKTLQIQLHEPINVGPITSMGEIAGANLSAIQLDTLEHLYFKSRVFAPLYMLLGSIRLSRHLKSLAIICGEGWQHTQSIFTPHRKTTGASDAREFSSSPSHDAGAGSGLLGSRGKCQSPSRKFGLFRWHIFLRDIWRKDGGPHATLSGPARGPYDPIWNPDKRAPQNGNRLAT